MWLFLEQQVKYVAQYKEFQCNLFREAVAWQTFSEHGKWEVGRLGAGMDNGQ